MRNVSMPRSLLGRAEHVLSNRWLLRRLVVTALHTLDTKRQTYRGVAEELYTAVRMLRAWLKGDYHDVTQQSLVVIASALLYVICPFGPDTLPKTSSTAEALGLALSHVRKVLEEFRVWEKTTVDIELA